MLRALRTAALGMSAQQASVDNTANNLANANTTGFKRQTVVFQDLLYQTVQARGEERTGGTTSAMQMGNGAAAVATVRSFTQGGLLQTGNTLDVAVSGDGFFGVRRPDGTMAFTRDGSFSLSAEGQIVTPTGLVLEPGLSVPAEAVDITISQDGLVRARVQGQQEPVDVGQIEVARFSNAAGLRSIGGNLYVPTAASGEAVTGAPGQDGLGTLAQGFLEGANVDVVQEMVGLITAQRAYELNSKMVQTSEEMLQIASNLKR